MNVLPPSRHQAAERLLQEADDCARGAPLPWADQDAEGHDGEGTGNLIYIIFNN